jgi:hypothetical protein
LPEYKQHTQRFAYNIGRDLRDTVLGGTPHCRNTNNTFNVAREGSGESLAHLLRDVAANWLRLCRKYIRKRMGGSRMLDRNIEIMLHFSPFAKKHDFRTIFSPQIKANPIPNTIYIVGETVFGFPKKQTPEPAGFPPVPGERSMYASKPET